MEWGIKLRSKKNKLLKKTFINFVIKILVLSICMPFGILLLVALIDRLSFQWLYDISPEVYNNFREFFYSITDLRTLIIPILIIWVIGTLVLLYRLLKKVFGYIDEVGKATEDLVNKDVEYIELPDELEEIQKRMNHLKRESEKNEKLAKENEEKKDELIVYLAHDIKTPLTSMIGYLSILDEIDDMPKKKQKNYISIALDKSYRLEDLINELFDVARFNSEKIVLEKEELNLNLMLEQIIDDFYPTLREVNKSIKLNYDEPISINGDSDKLSRVFNNLIKNAISYSKEESEIVINLKKDNNNAIVEVINKGRQISKEKLSKIFEKFYRLDSARTSRTGGSGLGLAIAKDIIELHNGTIIAESNEEETTFRVTLPLK
jgi:two-component system sensor histidine kinase VanS